MASAPVIDAQQFLAPGNTAPPPIEVAQAVAEAASTAGFFQAGAGSAVSYFPLLTGILTSAWWLTLTSPMHASAAWILACAVCLHCCEACAQPTPPPLPLLGLSWSLSSKPGHPMPQLVNHGADAGLLARMTAAMHAFFDLPLEEKLKVGTGRYMRYLGYQKPHGLRRPRRRLVRCAALGRRRPLLSAGLASSAPHPQLRRGRLSCGSNPAGAAHAGKCDGLQQRRADEADAGLEGGVVAYMCVCEQQRTPPRPPPTRRACVCGGGVGGPLRSGKRATCLAVCRLHRLI